ncbi:MAG: ATP-dependent DNA helicase RecG [Firmicutes bacterium]|nr:ATP-dependent DNA helicase RecG [Bacillota bacterium]
MLLRDDVSAIKNIGPSRKKILNALGMERVVDVTEYFPRDYEDRSALTPIEDMEEGERYTFGAKILSKPEIKKVKNLTITKCRIGDKTGELTAVWFNMPYIKNSITLNAKYIFNAKVYLKYGILQVENPEFEEYKEHSLNTGRIVPLYPLAKGISQKVLRQIIKDALEGCDEEFREFLPETVRQKYELCERNYAVKNIHFPESDQAFFKARTRLVFDELLLLQLRLFTLKGEVTKEKSSINIKKTDPSPFLKKLGFALTEAQESVIKEGLEDIYAGRVMNRLIQGDVGSGKTAVAALFAYIFACNGYQTALMAPTDVLANQHYKSLSPMFEALGFKCALLTSSVSKREKDAVKEALAKGDIDIAIGTHALLQDSVSFKALGLVVTDEQHRFGVRQREKLIAKGETPHVLVMSATPIPRTLALILYGDMDISLINSLPPGRQKVDTFAVETSYYPRIYAFIKKQVEEGGRCYVICPMIEEGEKESSLRNVVSYTEELKERLEGLRVECIHGKMKNEEKDKVMEAFAKGECDVLVATTVIEVGINVPEANLIIIENAERFGLSTLHQLRGRVGRGEKKSYCILISDKKTKTAKERLKTLCKSNNGFDISEKDMLLRGPGDFFGTRQHGIPDLKIANLYKDTEILKKVQEFAMSVYEEDRSLKAYPEVLEKLKDVYEQGEGEICL